MWNLTIEAVWSVMRRAALHTSALFFGTDFADALMGKTMIVHEWWEHHHAVFVTYAAFAATLIVYIDGHREKVKGLVREVMAEDSPDSPLLSPDGPDMREQEAA